MLGRGLGEPRLHRPFIARGDEVHRRLRCPGADEHAASFLPSLVAPLGRWVAHLRDGRLCDQCLAHATLHGAKDGIPALELDLALGGMYVDIDVIGGEVDLHDCQRVALGREQRMVGLLDGKGKAAVLYPASVDKERDVLPVAAVRVGWADVTRDADRLVAVRIALADLDHGLGDVQPVYLDQHVAQGAVARRAKRDPPLVFQRKAHVRIGHRVPDDHVVDVPALGSVPAQELEAGGDVVEQVLDTDRRTAGVAVRLVPGHACALDAKARAHLLSGGAGEHGELRHGSDAGQGLPSETQGANVRQVFDLLQLARCVAGKC